MVKICQFLHLTVKFLACFTSNAYPIETLLTGCFVAIVTCYRKRDDLNLFINNWVFCDTTIESSFDKQWKY